MSLLGHLDRICRLRDGLLLPLQRRQALQLLVLHASSARHVRRNHVYGAVSGLKTYVISTSFLSPTILTSPSVLTRTPGFSNVPHPARGSGKKGKIANANRPQFHVMYWVCMLNVPGQRSHDIIKDITETSGQVRL